MIRSLLLSLDAPIGKTWQRDPRGDRALQMSRLSIKLCPGREALASRIMCVVAGVVG